MTLDGQTLIPAGVVLALLGLVWRLARGVAQLEARIDAAETRADVQAETLADHEQRTRAIERRANRTRPGA